MKEIKFNLKLILLRKEFYIFILFLLGLIFFNILFSFKEASRRSLYAETISSPENLTLFGGTGFWILPVFIIGVPIFGSLAFCDLDFIEKRRKIDYNLSFRINRNKNRIMRMILIFLISFILIFFSLMLDYFCLKIILGNSLRNTFFISDMPAFLYTTSSQAFGNLIYSNTSLYVLFLNLYPSLILALVITLCYAVSFYINKKMVIYFIGPILLIISDFIGSNMNIKALAILENLQYNSFNNFNSFLQIIFLFGVSILLIMNKREKDIC